MSENGNDTETPTRRTRSDAGKPKPKRVKKNWKAEYDRLQNRIAVSLEMADIAEETADAAAKLGLYRRALSRLAVQSPLDEAMER